MRFLEQFYPNVRAKSVYDFPFEHYYAKGYRGLIFDIDNTLVFHGAPANAEAKALFKKLHAMGFSTMILSNNKERRVSDFARPLQSEYIYKAGKPFREGYIRAMEYMGTNAKNTMAIGDQIFTDIWGARLLGIFTVLVRPLHPMEEIQIILKRIPERLLLKAYEGARRRKKALHDETDHGTH